MKRVRLYGRRASQFSGGLPPLPSPKPTSLLGSIASAVTPSSLSKGSSDPVPSNLPKVLALPLTPDAFSAYGSVIQSYPDHRSARKDVVIKAVNFGTAFKFNHLAPVTYVPPPSRPDLANKGQVNFCVFRCEPQDGLQTARGKAQWEVKVLERHEFSSQAFVPMGGGGGRYLVIVCLPGAGESKAGVFPRWRRKSRGAHLAQPRARRWPAGCQHPSCFPCHQCTRYLVPPKHLASSDYRAGEGMSRARAAPLTVECGSLTLSHHDCRLLTLLASCTRRATLRLTARFGRDRTRQRALSSRKLNSHGDMLRLSW